MKFFQGLLTVISLCLIFVISGCAGTGVKVADAPQVIVTTDLDISQADIDRVKEEAKLAVNSICSIIGVEKQDINITIIGDGICHIMDGIIYLPRWHVENKRASIVPLVFYSLGRKIDNSFFRIGLGVYFHDRFGKDYAFPNTSGFPLNTLVRENRWSLFPIHELADNNDIWVQFETSERTTAFIQAGAFIKYLAERYGEKKLVDLYNSPHLDYRKIYGKDLKELGTEWGRSVLGDKYVIREKSYQYPAGIVTGPKAAFLISAPAGWILDNHSGLPQGLHCVLYPKGQTWADSDVKMYAKIASTQFIKKQDFINFAINANRKDDTGFRHKELRKGKTSEGFDYTIIQYELPRFSQYELVCYIQVPDAVAYIVFVARDTKSCQEYSGAFDEAVNSFLYKSDYINMTEDTYRSQKNHEYFIGPGPSK